MATLRQLWVDPVLTNMSIGHHPQGMVARDVMPMIKVVKESGKYYVWNIGDALRIPASRRADGARANQVDFGLTNTSTYSCEEEALECKITRRQRDNADSAVNLESSKVRRITDLINMRWESDVATLLTTTGNYASTNYTTLSSTNQWNNSSFSGGATGSGIEGDVDAGKEAVRQNSGGYEPNVIVIPAAVAKVVKRDPAVRELIKYTQNNLLVNGDLPPTLWGMKVVIPKVSNVTSLEGATNVFADLWGKHVAMLYVPQSPALDEPSFGYTFVSRDFQVQRWNEPGTDSDFFSVGFIKDQKVTSNVMGYLIASAIA